MATSMSFKLSFKVFLISLMRAATSSSVPRMLSSSVLVASLFWSYIYWNSCDLTLASYSLFSASICSLMERITLSRISASAIFFATSSSSSQPVRSLSCASFSPCSEILFSSAFLFSPTSIAALALANSSEDFASACFCLSASVYFLISASICRSSSLSSRETDAPPPEWPPEEPPLRPPPALPPLEARCVGRK